MNLFSSSVGTIGAFLNTERLRKVTETSLCASLIHGFNSTAQSDSDSSDSPPTTCSINPEALPDPAVFHIFSLNSFDNPRFVSCFLDICVTLTHHNCLGPFLTSPQYEEACQYLIHKLIANAFVDTAVITSLDQIFMISEVLHIQDSFKIHASLLSTQFEETVVGVLTANESFEWPAELNRWRCVFTTLTDAKSRLKPSKFTPLELSSLDRLYEVFLRNLSSFQSYLVVRFSDPQLHCFDQTELADLCRLLTIWSQISCKLREIHALLSESNERLEATSSSPQLNAFSANAATDAAAIHLLHLPISDALNLMPNFCVSESHPVCTPTHNTGGKLKSALKYQAQKECGKDSIEINPSFQGAKMNLLRELFPSHDSRSAFYQTFLISLKQAMKSVRLGEASMTLALFNDGDTLHNADSLDHLGSRTSLLLQPPAFATSVQGPLFGIPGCSIRDESVEEPSPTWSRQFHSSFTVHGVMTSWVSAVCTGAGLPWPTIRVSESVSSFVSLVVSAVIPGLLSLLDSDLQPSIDHVSSSNETSGAVRFTMFDSNQASEEQPLTASGSEDPHIPVPDKPEDRPMKYYFQPLVTSILRTLVQFLRGGASHAEFDGVLVQVQEVVAGAEDDLSGVKSVAGCISSCLLLRSLCHLLAQLFRDRFSVSVYEDVETLDKTANNNFATLAAELVKHYYSAICVLSENVVDLSIVHGDQLVSEIALYTCSGVDLDPPAVRFSKFLRNLWKVVSQTCPSGLARQILAQVSAKCLSYVVQLFTLPDFLESTTDADRLKTDLLILLDTAAFCLFACSETTAEVIGDGLMSGDISLLHWSATLLAQTLICRFMPNDVWDRVHGDGFYENLVKDGRPFAYASSNWLCFARPNLFTDVPISLVRERGQQTELEIEWELFEHGAHFDPIRLLSLLTSWDAKLSVYILTAPQLHAFRDLTEESDTAVRIFFAIFRICSLIPELDSFHSTVLLTVYSNSIQGATQPSTIDADSADLTALDHWPVWFRALLKLLDQQPINKLWESFHSLVQRHVFSDEFFSETCLLLTEGQSPAFLLSHHQPKRCSCWNTMFPSGQLPCGCEIPMPPRLDQISRLLRRSDDDTDTAADQPTLSKQQQARQLRLQRERTIGSYAFYYSQGGHLLCAWQELACDLIRSIIIALSTGLLLALSSLEKVLMDAQAHSSASPRLQGGCLSTHLLLAALLNRIHNAARQESMTSIQLLQHLILWEYLCGLIEASDREEADDEVADCKKRMLSYLEDLPNSLNESPEPADSTFAGRRFKLGQYVRTVQDQALPDLCFLHKFFKANIPWIRSLINRWRTNESTGAEIGPNLRDLDLVADDSDVPCSSATSYQELNWEHLSLVNIGLTKDTVRKLRDHQPDSSSERSSLET